MRRTTADTLKPKGRNLMKLQKSTNRSEKIGADRQNKIIPLTRKLQPLTRKVGGKFYGFIFLLKRIILGKFGTKKVLPIMKKHYRIAALLHDAFRKPHRQKVYLKPK